MAKSEIQLTPPPLKITFDKDGAITVPWKDWTVAVYQALSKTTQSGTTAERPTATYKGQQYFDTTIGKQIWFDGSSWVIPGLKSEIDGIPAAPVELPIGTILDYGGTTAPTNFVECDGAAVSRTVTYDQLFTAIGTTWGVGDGSTTFNLPDFRRRVTVGAGGSGTGTLGNSEGDTGGSETHTLTESEIPAHTHTIPTGTGGTGARFPATEGSFPSTVASGSTGGGGAHNNMQPSAVVMKVIRYQ
jgi:microcystin-dependent protein